MGGVGPLIKCLSYRSYPQTPEPNGSQQSGKARAAPPCTQRERGRCVYEKRLGNHPNRPVDEGLKPIGLWYASGPRIMSLKPTNYGGCNPKTAFFPSTSTHIYRKRPYITFFFFSTKVQSTGRFKRMANFNHKNDNFINYISRWNSLTRELFSEIFIITYNSARYLKKLSISFLLSLFLFYFPSSFQTFKSLRNIFFWIDIILQIVKEQSKRDPRRSTSSKFLLQLVLNYLLRLSFDKRK